MATTTPNASGKDMDTEHSTAATVTSSAVPVDYSHIHGGAENYDAHHSTSKIRSELLNLKSDLDTLMSRASSMNDHELHDAKDKMMAKFGSMQQSAKDMASRASQRAADARQQFSQKAADAKQQFSQKASDARHQLDQGVDVTTQYIQERPLQSVAIAAGVGFLLGALFRRD
ncbi:hypothetical protein Q8A64_08355 [Oxalobacteraceae bacterium R-40]|uniref:DUF883 domain-containing protein n=1 Tax=Keguizhuia sedimenti TaxID=3064264 RepID=A0ABU1BQZ0_9BURK|nr:hypothetical protein [Oxalobacteraceae bacterium R-40]